MPEPFDANIRVGPDGCYGCGNCNIGCAWDKKLSMGKTDWNTSHPGWRRAAEAGRSVGLEWGGDWKGFKDIPHFQYTGGLSLAECRALFADGIEAVWDRLV